MSLSVVILLLGAFLMWRAERALAFKQRVLGLVLLACDEDWRQLHGSVYWRLATWHRVPETRMVIQFWRPLQIEEWWPDTSFVDGKRRIDRGQLRAVK